MKALRYILIIINTIMMQSCVDMCSDGGEPIEEITVTYKNGSDENVYATIMTTTQQVRQKTCKTRAFLPLPMTNA